MSVDCTGESDSSPLAEELDDELMPGLLLWELPGVDLGPSAFLEEPFEVGKVGATELDR